MAESVLDASALLAYFNDEPGAEVVEAALARVGVASAVNWAEVLSKVADAGKEPAAFSQELAERGILGQLLELSPFAEENALEVGALRPRTRGEGLSLGDRACLDLARRLALPAYTADRRWSRLELGVEVRVIR